MDAFLVFAALVVGPNGPTTVVQMYPWATMESCVEYLKHPAPILHNWGTLTVLRTRTLCQPAKPPLDEKPA